MFKVASCQASTFERNIFTKREQFQHLSTCKKIFFKSRTVRSEMHGRDSLAFLGPKIWELNFARFTKV